MDVDGDEEEDGRGADRRRRHLPFGIWPDPKLNNSVPAIGPVDNQSMPTDPNGGDFNRLSSDLVSESGYGSVECQPSFATHGKSGVADRPEHHGANEIECRTRVSLYPPSN